ncbi:universal stress protein [Thermoactinospora rubra]|uniref:universal stress protein n=1 Tax=Thermoactinospora rubra TaxID=1088767 RepID=UPI000A101264|nr:universal stress protein [Thermoactinospora rubra]
MIIVAVDGSPAANAALDWAADDAVRMHEPLRIVHVLERLPYQIRMYPIADWPDPLRPAAEKIIQEAVARVRNRQPTLEVKTDIVEGAPAPAIQETGAEATQIVLGTRGLGGFAGALLGSVSTYVAEHAHCPVVAARPGQHTAHGEVVVGVDDSDTSRPALAYAFEQAKLRGARLRAVHAWQLPIHLYAPGIPYDLDDIQARMSQMVRDAVAGLRERYPEVTVVEDVRTAHPVDALCQASDAADLVVVGSHGRGAVGSLLLGSVSRGVLHHARSAVAVVRSSRAAASGRSHE